VSDYIKITNGQPSQYPYTVGDLRRDNPNTSFPKRPSNEVLAQWGVYPVSRTERPTINHTKSFSEGTPVLVGVTWTQVWEVFDATAEDVAKRIEGQTQHVRNQRDDLIADTDWMALSDNTLTAAWATHRQALRDITDHANFPYLGEDDWPVEPA